MELKLFIEIAKGESRQAFNRTAYGIEMGLQCSK